MEAIISSSSSSSEDSPVLRKNKKTLQKRLVEKQMREKDGATQDILQQQQSIIDSADDFEDDEFDKEEDEEDDEEFLDGIPTSPISNGSNSSSSSGNGNDNETNGHHHHHHIHQSSSFLSDSDAEHFNPLGESTGDSSEVPLVKLFQKFLNREAIKSLKQRHSQLNSKLLRLKKVVDNVKLRDRGQQLRKEKEKIKELIKLKKNQLNDQMNAPPFLRLMDKFAFTLGLIVLMVSEFVLLRSPEYMYLWYTILIFPLMAIRFIMYHRAKYHYFMLDFCYLCQFLLITYLFGHQTILGENVTPAFFKLVFALSNGPLAWGCIVWRNSMVFHDVDKLTSVFIHLCPPIVTFCLRWYPLEYPFELACGGASCDLTYTEAYLVPILLYFFWQAFYIIKTEYVDENKLANDQDIMTSSRWMSVKQPHPIYKFLKSKGINITPVVTLMITQLIYTFCTLLALPIFMNSFIAHSSFLFFIFVMVSWNGACYYFEVFSENYNKRFKSDMGNKLAPPCNKLKISSFYSFIKFFSIFFVTLFVYLKFILSI